MLAFPPDRKRVVVRLPPSTAQFPHTIFVSRAYKHHSVGHRWSSVSIKQQAIVTLVGQTKNWPQLAHYVVCETKKAGALNHVTRACSTLFSNTFGEN